MKYAPKRDDGLLAYVVTKRSVWDAALGGNGRHRIEWAATLADAKRKYGWTRELHTTVKVRRATPDDLARIPGGDA